MGTSTPERLADVGHFSKSCLDPLARGMGEDAPHPWTCRAPVFRPSEEEFADFEAFVSSIEPACVDFGIAKVVPPDSWRRPAPAIPSSFLMSSPTLQTVDARGHGRYHISHRQCPSVTLERFERMAASAVRREGVGSGSVGEGEAAGVAPSREAAALFWSGLEKQPSLATVMSAADMDASRFPEPDDQPEWNLRVPMSESKLAQASASWLSGGCVPRQSMPQTAPSSALACHTLCTIPALLRTQASTARRAPSWRPAA